MDLSYPPSAEAFRLEVRQFLDAHLPPGWSGMGGLTNEAAEAFSITWRRTLSEAGLIGLTWPPEYGGGGRSKIDQVVLAEELARAGVPMGRVTDATSVKMLGNTLVRVGHRGAEAPLPPPDRLGRATSGCQGYSEPDAGSDLAGLRTAGGRRRGRVGRQRPEDLDVAGATTATGSSCWPAPTRGAPSTGASASCCVPWTSPGVEVRTDRDAHRGHRVLRGLLHRRPGAAGHAVVGQVNGGWAVAMSLLGLERGEEAATNPILFRAELDRLVEPGAGSAVGPTTR